MNPSDAYALNPIIRQAKEARTMADKTPMSPETEALARQVAAPWDVAVIDPPWPRRPGSRSRQGGGGIDMELPEEALPEVPEC